MASNNNNKPKISISNIVVLLILILAIVGIVQLFNRGNSKTSYFSANEFISELEKESIVEMVITPETGDNNLFYRIEGKYRPNTSLQATQEFQTRISVDVFNYYIQGHLNDDYIKNVVKFNYNNVSQTDWLMIIMYIGVPILLVIALFVFLNKNGNSNKQAFDFAKSRARLSKGTTVNFNDVAGCDEEKYEMEEIIDFLRNPKKYFEIGARIPKGVILVGPPGTGKTLLAKAVAGEAQVPFYSISGSDFVEMFVGVGASRVRDMFKTAKQNAPCIVFIDEIDAVGRQRGAGLGGGHDEREQTLNQLLVEMDGFGENSGIIVMAATNRVDILDPALLRPGRFDRQITIGNPDVKGRCEILKVHARNKKLSPRVHLEEVAKRTPGFSGADLENLLNEAALLAARDNRREIKIYDIDEAIDRVIMGPAKKSKKYSDKEKRMVAFHEAGHAVLGVVLENAETVQKVTIVPRGQAGGYAMMTPDVETFTQTKKGLIDTITGLLGGRVSEEIFIGEISTGAHNDIQKSTSIARAMVAEYGMSELGPIQYENSSHSVFLGRDYMSEKNFSDQIALEIDHAVKKIVDECYEIAKNELTKNKALVELIANHLYEIETLTKEDIYELVNTGKLAWYEKKKAKAEAEKVALEKESELQDMLKKQLEELEKPQDNKEE